MSSSLDREGVLRSLLSLSLLACLTDSALSNTPVTVPPEVVDYVLRAGGPGSGIPDWNCLEVPFVQTSLVCITANDQSGDGERISELLASTKVVAEYLITVPGPIADASVNGTLWGMELRFMEEAPWTEPLSALVVADLMDNGVEVLATVYCYDAQQYQDRKVQVMNEMGAQFSMYPVWPGCTLSGTSQSSTSLQVAGWENVVYGSVYSGGTLRLAGDSNRISGSLLYAGGLLISGTSHDYHFAQKVARHIAQIAIVLIKRVILNHCQHFIVRVLLIEHLQQPNDAGGNHAAGKSRLLDEDQRVQGVAVVV